MNDVKKSWRTALAIGAGGIAIIGGSWIRDYSEVGQVPSLSQRVLPLDGLLASRKSDVSIPVGDYYAEMVRLLKSEYVDNISDDRKLAAGAVKGMVGSLGDIRSLSMDPSEFRAFLNTRQGEFEGVGVDLTYELLPKVAPRKTDPGAIEGPPEDATEAAARAPSVPRLVVSALVPGSAAAKAGVQPGDWIEQIDSHWVVEEGIVRKMLQAQRDFTNRKINYEQYAKVQGEFRTRMVRALMPARARDRVVLGKTGTLKVIWRRGKDRRETTLQKGTWKLPSESPTPGATRLTFLPGDEDKVLNAVKSGKPIVLDLRNSMFGDESVMRSCLALIAPAGIYGQISTDRKEAAVAFKLAKGNANPPKSVKLLVDRTTGGVAEIFALALNSRGIAKLVGGQTSGDRAFREIVQLPDGSGYTLHTGTFKVGSGGPTKVAVSSPLPEVN